jgi:hypothetical protein
LRSTLVHNRGPIEHATTVDAVPASVSLLRRLDVALWMFATGRFDDPPEFRV